ncbi:hypothetical protein [Marinobacter sp.]|uniref:hypothetical protein n=1 Tax=Marinobacter sp. TaxID=50741 RepID=UPI00356B0A2B
MNHLKKLALALAVSSTVAITGCSNSSGSSAPSGETISGTASAPGGVIASLVQPTVFDIALNFVVSPVAAAITGLEPIEGAKVELIRVDDEGTQIGDVLTSTTTSVTGDYTLTLPENVNLAGNLIVRITGRNNQQLRAQVVEKNVDISPVSEFVLRKFIETGADLDQLIVTDVVKLSGRVEEFDMTAGANLDEMFDTLEREIGDFVENEVAVVAGGKGEAGTITGEYRSVAFALQLHDSDNNDPGTYAHDLWTNGFRFEDGGENIVNITLGYEDTVYGSMSGTSIANAPWLNHVAEFEEDIDETFSGRLTQSGILAVEGEFEEEIDDDTGWRWPAQTYSLVQAGERGLFINQPNEASVRYAVIDTNGDDEPDAVDPDQKLGDEVSRSFEIFARLPTNFKDSDLSGEFGRVYIASGINDGELRLTTEVNTLTFPGDGSFDYTEVSEGHGHEISLSATGPDYTPLTDPASSGTLVINSSGDITEISDEPADGFINDEGDFIAIWGGDGEFDSYSEADLTLMTKLAADGAPSVAGKQYRMQLVSMALGNQERFLLSSSKFNTFLEMSSETEGTVNGNILEIEKAGLAGQLSVSTDSVEDANAFVSIEPNGATTVTISDTDGSTTLDGFFNADATIGLFALRWAPTKGNPDELGLVILTETK